MKITMYELLGLIKDNKAPKKIKFKNEMYEYNNSIENNFIDYIGIEKENNVRCYLSSYIGNNYLSDMLIDEVEIIEEPKKIEKLPKNITDNACATRDQRTIANKINELIDEINNLKEK